MQNNILILEDDEIFREYLCKQIKSCDDNIEVYEFSTKDEALEFIKKNRVDIFLLDIMLDDKNKADNSGIIFATEIRAHKEFLCSEIIFITSLAGLQAQLLEKIHCFDYIEKPFSKERVEEVIKAVLNKVRGKQEKESEKIVVRIRGVCFPVLTKKIIMIEGHSRSVVLHLLNEERATVVPNTTLTPILARIQEERFLVARRGVAVNARFIKRIDPVNRYVEMYGGKKVDIGRKQKERFMRAYQELYH